MQAGFPAKYSENVSRRGAKTQSFSRVTAASFCLCASAPLRETFFGFVGTPPLRLPFAEAAPALVYREWLAAVSLSVQFAFASAGFCLKTCSLKVSTPRGTVSAMG